VTEKQEKILHSALHLFAQKGFDGTSTRQVAQRAEVSEGLIFRHFGSKEGLLEAILKRGEEMAAEAVKPVLEATAPKEVIAKALEMPFEIKVDSYQTWRLIYALKWQTDRYSAVGLEVLRQKLSEAFAALGCEDPVSEAEIVLMYLDGAATALLLHPPQAQHRLLQTLKKKYALQ